MVAFLADENFNGTIFRGLRRRAPELDMVRAQDVGLVHQPDPVLLEWSATRGRVLLTHDVQTVPRYAYMRVAAGLLMPGVVIVSRHMSVGDAIEQIVLLAYGNSDDEWPDRVHYLPL